MKKTILLIFLTISISSFSQNDSINPFQKDLNELKIQNEILSEKLNVYQDTNDKIVNITFLSVGSLVAFIIGLGIWNSVVSYRINNKKLDNLKDSLKDELTAKIEKRIEQKFAIERIESESRISKLEDQLLNSQIEILKLNTVSRKFQPSINMETFSLSDLLDKTYEKYNRSSAYDYELKQTLEAMVQYTKDYQDLPNMEVDRIHRSLIKVEDEKFSHLIKVIKENIHPNSKNKN